MLSYRNILLENSIWQDYERVERTNRLRKLLELDSLPKVMDSQIARDITIKFLFAANGKKQPFPQLIGIGGGPGAGKSFTYDNMRKEGLLPVDAIIHDPDLVMQSIPQYREDAAINPEEAFKKWELPARQLANYILLKALLSGYNIIYIRSFALSDSLNFVRAAKAFGYKFDVHMITCDLKIALDRAKERESITKRHIPPETLVQRHKAVLELIPEIISISDSYYIYENNKDGASPILANTSIKDSTIRNFLIN